MAGARHYSSGTLSQMLRSAKTARRSSATASGRRGRSRRGQLCVATGLALVALAAGVGLLRGHAQQSFPLPAIDPPKTKAAPAPQPATQNKSQAPAMTTESPRSGVAGDCADLLKMATDLKIEVDKTTRDTLSVTVVRKAGEIEQLARKVRTGNGKD